jgi:multiple sugar transport system substrate-binding protein
MKKHVSILLSFLLVSVLILSGCGCKKSQTTYRVKLEVWGLFDDSETMSEAISEFQKRNPRVREINYKKLTVDSYEQDLLDVLATGNGPDIFLIHNTWLGKHKDKMASVPMDNLTGGKTEILNTRQVGEQFTDVVSRDFTADGKIYALPLSVDSLALYFNRDLLNQAGISEPPKTWIDFDEAVKKMTKSDSFGNIVLSGAAMGTSSDASAGTGKINRATDILTLLMLQSGAEMTDKKTGQTSFADYKGASTIENKVSPGENALAYFTKFSNPYNSVYSWNSLQHNSTDSFIEGKTAMTINYSWLIPKIGSRAPKLNFGVSKVPQNKDGSGRGVDVDFANYWGFAVSGNKIANQADVQNVKDSGSNYATNEQRIAEAWKFVRFLTMSPAFSQNLPVAAASNMKDFDPAAKYAEQLKKPAARRDIIEKQKSDVLLGPFAEGNLIAQSWPEQPDNLAVERIFDEMIDDVVLRNKSVRDSIEKAQNAVNVLMQK